MNHKARFPAKPVYTAIGLLFLLMAAAVCSKKPTGSDGHHEHATGSGETAAGKNWSKPARKFIADEALKVRMTRVLEIMKAMHEAESKPAGDLNIPEIGKKVDATVQDIFKNCKLAPDADAAIHPVLAELLKGAALLMQGDKKAGHEIIHNALLRYEDYFIHPGWNH